MSPLPRVVVITSDLARHRYVSAGVARELPVAGIVCETKGPPSGPAAGASPADDTVIASHFRERDRAEVKYLGPDPAFPDVPIRAVPQGGSNDPGVFEWVRKLAPDLVLLYGSSIIRTPLLDAYSARMINLHLGLSPYYRGSGTNFWPLVNGEPECVGATLHLAVAKVDAGPVLAQVRPDPIVADRAHDLGTKTLMAAADLLPSVATAFHRGALQGVQQDLSSGRVYRVRDFTAESVRVMRRNFDEGMMERFMEDRWRRLEAFPIVGATLR